MIVVTISTTIILIWLLIALSNARKNRGLFKQLGKYGYEPITPEFSLEQLDNLPLDDERIVKEYKNIADILLEEFGILVLPLQQLPGWRYSVTSKYKGDFLGSKKNYLTKQEAYRAAFIHVLKEWI
jgi:hypothetical protein